MANPSNIDNMLTAIRDDDTKTALKAAFRYFMGDTRFGRATGTGQQSQASTSAKATNLGGFFLSATTPSVANQEFAVAHTLGHAPYLWMVVAPCDVVGAGIPRLVVSRAADPSNLYFKSADTAQLFYLYIEG